MEMYANVWPQPLFRKEVILQCFQKHLVECMLDKCSPKAKYKNKCFASPPDLQNRPHPRLFHFFLYLE